MTRANQSNQRDDAKGPAAQHNARSTGLSSPVMQVGQRAKIFVISRAFKFHIAA
jgi:hypothetical protein